MENSVSTPMEVVATTQDSTNTSNNDKPEQKMNNRVRKAMFYKNKLRRAVHIRRKYLSLKNKRNNNSLVKKGSVSSPPSNNKTDTSKQTRRRGSLVKHIHLERNGIDISFDLTESEQKMLEFYKVKLSVLKTENENLHLQLESLAKANMRLLQMEPIRSSVS